MLQIEFENRVGMQVSAKEYEAIEVVYINSDLEKDDFCKMWAKMNARRISNYKAEQKAEREEQAKKEKAFNLYCGLYSTLRWDNYNKPVEQFLTSKQLEFCESLGIGTYEQTGSTVRYELGKYCGAIK